MPFRVNAFEFPCNVTIKLKLHYIGSCIRHGMRHVSIENHVIYSFRTKKNLENLIRNYMIVYLVSWLA